MRKLIIDCDTGTDDAIALLAAFACKDIEILGITCVNGNVTENHVARKNLDMCEYVGANYPICRGASLPLSSGYRNTADTTHGSTGLGTIILPEAKNSDFDKRIASRFLYEKAVEQKGELELLVIGPMTNIALAIIQYPDFNDLVKHIWFMGGSTTVGNITPSAEFNVWADPEAAHTVLCSGIPLTMIGLNVTLKAIMEKEDVKKLRENNTKASVLAADLLDFMAIRFDEGGEDIIMHDALALAAIAYPECLKYKNYFVDVETTGTYTRGNTFVDLSNKTGNEANVTVAVDVDVKSFRKWLVDTINSYRG